MSVGLSTLEITLKLYSPFGLLTLTEALKAYREHIKLLLSTGKDLGLELSCGISISDDLLLQIESVVKKHGIPASMQQRDMQKKSNI